MKKCILITVLVVLLSCQTNSKYTVDIPESLNHSLQVIPASPEKGVYWPALLYVPESMNNDITELPILVVTNNTGNPSSNFQKHFDKAIYDIEFYGYWLGDNLGVPVLMPVFPRTGGKIDQHGLCRNTLLSENEKTIRIDLQLTKMIKDASRIITSKGYTVCDKVLFWGFSASATHALRYTAIHPEKVLAVVAGAPGGFPILPISEYHGNNLNYPLGVGDMEANTGTPFNYDDFSQIPFYLFLGEKDQNDAVTYRDNFTRQDQILVFELFGETPNDRWKTTSEIYKSINSKTQTVLYRDMGHVYTDKVLEDSIKFLRKNMVQE